MLNIRNDLVCSAIQEVAHTVILPRFRALKCGDIRFKSGDDPVTIVDQEAEIALERHLLPLIRGSLLVGEERFAQNHDILTLYSGENIVWTVDPLDGTKNFIAGEPFFGLIVSAAKQNETIAAWLYDVLSDEFVTAELGAGAYHKGVRLAVLPPAPLERMEGVIGSGIRSALAASATGTGGNAAPAMLHRMMCSCHDYARLVVGGAHFSGKVPQIHFRSGLHCTPWDNGAGVLIHAEAGGYTAHFDGERFRPSHYGRGLLSAPDKESWGLLRDWIKGFCGLSEERDSSHNL